MTTAELHALVAEQRVRDVLSAYTDALDTRDRDTLADLFAADATVELPGTTLRGRERIVDHVCQSLSRFVATSHHVGNQRVVVDGDQAIEHATVYAFHRARDPERLRHVSGRYELHLRYDHGWRITRMTLHGVDEIPDEDPVAALVTGPLG